MSVSNNQMSLKLRHILLLAGILMIVLSFLFFGRATSTYNIIILSGLSVSLIAYLVILFKDSSRIRIFWTLIVLAGIGLQWLTEPFMIRMSYLFYVRQNDLNLSKINQIFIAKPGNVSWVYDSTLWKRNGLSETEGKTIKSLVKSKNISLIAKDSEKIYFRTFGMLDVSHGLYYFYSSEKPDTDYRHITGSWYY